MSALYFLNLSCASACVIFPLCSGPVHIAYNTTTAHLPTNHYRCISELFEETANCYIILSGTCVGCAVSTDKQLEVRLGGGGVQRRSLYSAATLHLLPAGPDGNAYPWLVNKVDDEPNSVLDDVFTTDLVAGDLIGKIGLIDEISSHYQNKKEKQHTRFRSVVAVSDVQLLQVRRAHAHVRLCPVLRLSSSIRLSIRPSLTP